MESTNKPQGEILKTTTKLETTKINFGDDPLNAIVNKP